RRGQRPEVREGARRGRQEAAGMGLSRLPVRGAVRRGPGDRDGQALRRREGPRAADRAARGPPDGAARLAREDHRARGLYRSGAGAGAAGPEDRHAEGLARRLAGAGGAAAVDRERADRLDAAARPRCRHRTRDQPVPRRLPAAVAMRGRFITFEGGEGTGKSTHAALLADRPKGLGIAVVRPRERGGPLGAEALRHVLLSGVAKPLGVEAEALLFAAARADHVDSTIAPALARGAWVICDRFIDSTRVYQGALGRLDANVLRALERVTVGDLMPDLTVVLDLPPEVG